MIVGLSGYARTGKNEAASGLMDLGFIELAFADTLRNCLYTLDPYIAPNFRLSWAIDADGWDKAKVVYPEIRALLQRFGTDVGRKLIDDNIWVNATLGNLDSFKNYVVTDCRFPNEAYAIKQLGGKMIRISRPGVGPINNHASETSLDNFEFDANLLNDGSVDVLHSDIRNVVKNAGWV